MVNKDCLIVTFKNVILGDITPVTLGGKLISTLAISCGILTLALPITIIGKLITWFILITNYFQWTTS
jgi:hypothetical protein